MSTHHQADLRALPAVHALAADVARAAPGAPAWNATEAARRVLRTQRDAIRAGSPAPSPDALLQLALAEARRLARPRTEPVINATGVLIHTGLGRSPLADHAADALAHAARAYVPVEIEPATGRRGRRADIVEPLLCRLTGAQAATVVNNNAAATLLTLAALARDRWVIVSRGELVEIGGSFRLPDVFQAGGARLYEVGTTNRTRPADYEHAVRSLADRAEPVAAIMKVHTSNYRITGFTAQATVADLAPIARRHGLPLIHDIGSGLPHPVTDLPALADEPDARSSLRDGADLVLFSGDKLLGGPQAGVILGSRSLVDRIERHPLMRALRVGRLTLTALEAALRDWCAGGVGPALRLALTPVESLMHRARRVADRLATDPRLTRAAVGESRACLGGGSAPDQGIPSAAVELRARDLPEDELARRLRDGSPRVFPRVADGSVWLDLRSVLPDQDCPLAQAVLAALG